LNWAKGAFLKKLFVGNLPYQASEAELQDWFTQAGFQADSVQIIRDKFTGEPRGFGFAEFSNDAEADRAVQTCNGQDFLGRSLVVNEARPMREGGGRGPGGGGGGGGRGRPHGGGGGGGGRGGGRGRDY
jgi:RNA recognition motif-containing protein